MEFKLGVCCDFPISPIFDQAEGDHDTLLDVLIRLDTFREDVVNADAFALASPLMVSCIVWLEVSSVSN